MFTKTMIAQNTNNNGDFSMLSLVGNPRAINPSKELITRIKNDENRNPDKYLKGKFNIDC